MQNYRHPFVKHVRHQCKRYGCKLKLIYKELLEEEDGSTCEGYFSDDPLELVVATRCLYTDFISTLVHEYSHFEQWIEESKYFAGGKYFSGGKYNYHSILERWIGGENFTKKTIERTIDVVRNCELDCERRSVENIKKYNLPINIEKYCKNASAYIYFYNFIKKTRVWETKHKPSDCKKIIDIMPTDLSGNFSRTPRNIMKLYIKHLK